MSIRQSLVAGLLGNGCAALVGLAVVPLYLRLLGPDGYGLVGFLATLQGWAVLADLGISAAASRELARFGAGTVPAAPLRALLRAAELAYACIAVLLGLLVFLLSEPLSVHWLQSQVYAPTELARAVALMALVLGAQWMATLYRNCLLGLHRQVAVGAMTGAVALLRGCAGVGVLAGVSASIEAFLWVQVAVGALESGTLRLYLSHHLPAALASRAGLGPLRAIMPFALGVAATVLLGTVLMQLDKLLVARLVPLDHFGYFMLAVTIGTAFSVLVVPIDNVAYPRFSGLVAVGSERELAQQYHAFSQLAAVGVFPPALLLALFAETFLHLWTGDAAAARAAAPVLSVWGLAMALNSVMHVPYAVQLAHGWTRLAATLNVVAVTCMVPALLLLVPKHGAVAAAWVWVGVNALYLCVGVPLMHRRILRGEQAAWYFRDLLGPLLTCALASLAALAAYGRVAPATRLQEALFLVIALLVLTVAAAAGSPLARRLALASFARPTKRA